MTYRQFGVPVLLLLLFWVLLPTSLPQPRSGASAEQCQALAAQRPAPAAAAVGALERCTTTFPDNVELLGDLAAAYEEAGRPADAEKACRAVLERDPGFAEMRLRLARLYLRRGAAAEAAREAERALRVQPNRAALLELRGQAEAALRSGSK